MRIRDDEDEGDAPEVNMAPLIDCIFLLLIFFLLTSTIQKNTDEKKEIQELAFLLPESAAAADAPAQPEILVIGVDDSGRAYVNNARVSLEELHRALRTAAASRPKVRIEGDERAAFEHIAHVIDLCEFEGLRDIAVRTRDKP